MFHSDQSRMIDDMIEHPEGLIVESRSKQAILYIKPDGEAVLIEGDFSHRSKKLDEKIQRFAQQMKDTAQ